MLSVAIMRGRHVGSRSRLCAENAGGSSLSLGVGSGLEHSVTARAGLGAPDPAVYARPRKGTSSQDSSGPTLEGPMEGRDKEELVADAAAAAARAKASRSVEVGDK